MPASPYAERRIALYDVLRRAGPNSLRLDPAMLRFSLGVTLADLRVPFHLAPEVAQMVPLAARQLALLLVQRHPWLVSEADRDRLLLSDDVGEFPSAPKSLSPSSGGPDVRATAAAAMRHSPLLTGGVMTTWLGAGGGGRSLVALFILATHKAAAEMQRTRGREETPALAALMLSTTFAEVAPALRRLALGPGDRAALSSAAIAIQLAATLGVERGLADAGPDAAARLLPRVQAALSPVLLWGRPSPAAATTLYGPELTAGIPDQERVLSLMPEIDDAAAQAELDAALKGEAELLKRAELAVAIRALRDKCLEAAVRAEGLPLPPELSQCVQELALRPGALGVLLADEKERKQLSKAFGEWSDQAPAGVREPLAALKQVLKKFSPRDPADAAGFSRSEARSEYVRAATAYLCDLALERMMAPARRAMEARTGNEAEGGLEAEYEAGRLYRLTTGEQPILKAAVNPPVAHLFVDLKDFTRRTALLGQAAMADFLRREFYVPILAAAKKHYGGLTQLADRGGISLNNLLGDAISLSGQIDALVALGADIRRHLAAYARQLRHAVTPDQVAEAEAAAAARYDKLLAAARPAVRALLEAEREAALSRARGELLEAGVFISHGPAPLVITIPDDVFGASRVAIAEKINESARGTARSDGARARSDALLRAASAYLGRPLQHPWSVFCDAPLSISFPGPVEVMVREALKSGQVQRAKEIAAQTLDELLDEAAHRGERPGEIHNAGVALSEEALSAYQEAVGETRILRKVEIDPEDLHPEIRDRYFFPPGRILLWVSYHPHGEVDLVFRSAGRVMFKGFEHQGGISVWELADEFGIAKLLAHHHGAQWLRGASK